MDCGGLEVEAASKRCTEIKSFISEDFRSTCIEVFKIYARESPNKVALEVNHTFIAQMGTHLNNIDMQVHERSPEAVPGGGDPLVSILQNLLDHQAILVKKAETTVALYNDGVEKEP